MEELIKIIQQFLDNGYTCEMMEYQVNKYTEESEKSFDAFTVNEIICALEEEQSCWEG